MTGSVKPTTATASFPSRETQNTSATANSDSMIISSTMGKDEYSLSIDKTQWDALPAMKENELEQGSIAMADSDRRRVEASFGKNDAAASSSVPTDSAMTSHLIRVSDLRGKDLHSGSREIGEIEGLVIDSSSGFAMALVDVKKNFVQADQKFLVPVGRLTVGAGTRDDITTMLTSADFSRQGSVTASAAASSIEGDTTTRC